MDERIGNLDRMREREWEQSLSIALFNENSSAYQMICYKYACVKAKRVKMDKHKNTSFFFYSLIAMI